MRMVHRWKQVKRAAVRKTDSDWHADLPFHTADIADEGASIILHQTFLDLIRN